MSEIRLDIDNKKFAQGARAMRLLSLTQRVCLFAMSHPDGLADTFAGQRGWARTLTSLKRRRLAKNRGGRWYTTKAGRTNCFHHF